jgi:hypothetical protein
MSRWCSEPRIIDVDTVWCVSNVEAEKQFESLGDCIWKDALQVPDMEWIE